MNAIARNPLNLNRERLPLFSLLFRPVIDGKPGFEASSETSVVFYFQASLPLVRLDCQQTLPDLITC